MFLEKYAEVLHKTLVPDLSLILVNAKYIKKHFRQKYILKSNHSFFEGHNPPPFIFLHPFHVKPPFFEIFTTPKDHPPLSKNFLLTPLSKPS